MKKKLSFSICIPVYKGSSVLKQAIISIIDQNYKDIEIIIGDDNPPESKEEINKTKKVIASFKDKRIRYVKHKTNLGCQENLNRIVSLAKKEIVYLVAQDDIISRDSIVRTNEAFFMDKDIGAVTRGYFWFDKSINMPVRIKKPVNDKKDTIVSIDGNPDDIVKVFQTVDNITGLAFKRKLLTTPFHQDLFTTHIHPFAAIFKNHKVVCLKDYIFAARIELSQSRGPRAYSKSPMQSWIDMFKTVFKERKFKKMRDYCIRNFVSVNYVGLVQVRNYSTYGAFLHEVLLLIKYRPINLLSIQFWFFTVGCAIMPRNILIPLVDWYKSNIHSAVLPRISFRTV